MAAASTVDPPSPDVRGDGTTGREAAILFALAALQFVGIVDVMIVMPLGIALGTRIGWQAPFFALAALGLPLVGLAAWALPPLAAHVDGTRRHPFARLLDTLTVPAYVRGFALIAMLMVGAFSVIPFISTSLVANVVVTQDQLPAIFITGGLLTLLTTPLIGRLVDRFGALPVFCGIVPMSAGMMLMLTHLPAVGIFGAATTLASLWLAARIRPVARWHLVPNDRPGTSLRSASSRQASEQLQVRSCLAPLHTRREWRHETTEPTATIQVAAGSSEITPVSRTGPRQDAGVKKPAGAMDGPAGVKWRGQDSNLRPRGYEPRELPGCSTPRQCAVDVTNADGRWTPATSLTSG